MYKKILFAFAMLALGVLVLGMAEPVHAAVNIPTVIDGPAWHNDTTFLVSVQFGEVMDPSTFNINDVIVTNGTVIDV